MYLIFVMFLYSGVLFSFGQSENLTLAITNTTIIPNITPNGSKTDVLNKTKLTLVSEGGTLLPNEPNTLPKQKLNSLITLDEELTKTKIKAVVPRKGVDNMQADLITEEKNVLESESSKTNNMVKTTVTLLPTAQKSSDKHVTSALPNTSTTLPPSSTTILHKKPLTLSAEALANWDKKLESEKLKIHSAPSTETMASSKIPSPKQETIVKVYPNKANNSHPGMIMPIVITILVVPMFAIVGYMALKRGQEAWKNRHYKRMDFLLDGMYND